MQFTVATEEATSGGKAISVSYVDTGLDAAAASEAVQKDVKTCIPVMIIGKDEVANKALIYARVPPKVYKYEESDLHEWSTSVFEPLEENRRKRKGGLCSGQGKHASGLEEAMNMAKMQN